MHRMFQIGLALISGLGVAYAAANPDFYSVQDFGAHGDGQTDDTRGVSKSAGRRRRRRVAAWYMRRVAIISFPAISKCRVR